MRVTAEPASATSRSGGLTPLLYAAREGCLECAKALVEGGRRSSTLADPDGVTPLMMALTNAHFDVAAYLVERGADVNRWDWWGRTPLYAAVDYNTIPRGGRADRPSLDETTTSLEMIEILLKAGANPNAQLKFLPPFRDVGADRGGDLMLPTGATPLLRAAKAGDAEAVKLLLAAGARHRSRRRAGLEGQCRRHHADHGGRRPGLSDSTTRAESSKPRRRRSRRSSCF